MNNFDKNNVHLQFETNFEKGIDPQHWLILNHQWGNQNGGCIPENVSLDSEGLILKANGDFYQGLLKGINHNKEKVSHGKRTGAALISKNTLGPGSFEIYMKPCPKYGVCTAFWTWYGDNDLNHEIDIELPGHLNNGIPSFNIMINNTWITEKKYEKHFTLIHDTIDGKYHKFRFDWHTEPKKVEFYYDDKLVHTNTKNVPTIKSNINFGVWFPKDWAGIPEFETSEMRVKYFKYTPFFEKSDENKINISSELGCSKYPKNNFKF